MKYVRRSRRNRPASPRQAHQPNAYVSQLRAEACSILNRMRVIRKHGPKPYEIDLRKMDERSLRAANRLSSVVLP